MKKRNLLVFNQKIAGMLMTEGCKLLNIAPNKEDETKFVFYFPNTDYVKDRLKKCIEQYKNK